MRLAMVSYFDVSESFGLSDEVFEPGRLAPGYDLGSVGLANPLGRGVALDLRAAHPDLMQRWRDAAIGQLDRPEMEIEFGGAGESTGAQFTERLRMTIQHHPLTRCDVTVYAVGVALLRLDFGPGVPVELLRGLSRCFEFAAYTPGVSDELYISARQAARAAVPGVERNGLVDLTARAGPERSADATGYAESSLLARTGFTNVLLCVDPGDGDLLDAAMRVFELDEPPADRVVQFEFHGTLWFDWATCVLHARHLDQWTGVAEPGRETPEQSAARMLACVEIAHTFLGACEAFRQLFLAETRTQIGGYAGAETAGRGSQDLNRLRTLALALVSLTNVDLVTPTDEDRRYFALFEAEAKIAQRHLFIQETCEILYNVQEAEFQWQQSRRDRALGYFLAGLTSLTLISVMADAYNFVSGQNTALIEQRTQRVQLLLVLALFGGTLVLLLLRPRRLAQRRRGPI
jgi:hypothetical protein